MKKAYYAMPKTQLHIYPHQEPTSARNTLGGILEQAIVIRNVVSLAVISVVHLSLLSSDMHQFLQCCTNLTVILAGIF